jgi:hypothetical protein
MFYTQGTFPVMPTHREWDAVHDALEVVLPKTYNHMVPGVQLETAPDLARYLQRRQQELTSFAEDHGVESWATRGFAAPEELNRGTFVATVIARWSRLTELLHDPDGHMPELFTFVAEDIAFSWVRVAEDLPDSFTTIHKGVADHRLPTEIITCGNLPAICFIEGAQTALRSIFSDAGQWRDFCWQMPLEVGKQI